MLIPHSLPSTHLVLRSKDGCSVRKAHDGPFSFSFSLHDHKEDVHGQEETLGQGDLVSLGK